MPKRPSPPTHSHSSPQVFGNALEVPAPTSPGLAPHPRSASPSGLTGFFSKSARWFGRSSSSQKTPLIPEQASVGRPSFSSSHTSSFSSTRRPTISHPTDPRPILNVPNANLGASQSVLDLGSTLERDDPHHPHPSHHGPQSSKSVSDLRTMSKRTWSRSVDDLAQFNAISSPPPSSSSPKLSKINTTKVMVEKYRTAGTNSPSSATSLINSPQLGGSPRAANPPLDGHPTRSGSGGALGPAHSPSPNLPATLNNPTKPNPTVAGSTSTKASGPSGPGTSTTAIHTRSLSHGPLHPSHPKPSSQPLPPTPTFNRTFVQDTTPPPPIPIPSARRRTSSDKEKDKGHFGGLTGFPFHFGASAGGSGGSSHAGKTGGLLASSPPEGLDGQILHNSPPQVQVVPPSHTTNVNTTPTSATSGRASQIIHASGFVNKFDLSSKFAASPSLNLEKGWKPFKAHLQGTKLYLYKPPPDRIGEVKELFGIGPEPERDMSLEVPNEAPQEEKSEEVGGRRKRNISDEGRGRAKRAYWGRTTHARLMVVTEGDKTTINSGSGDALVHEMVFATMFADGGFSSHPSLHCKDEGVEDTSESTQNMIPVTFADDWTRFARTVLLFVPGRFLDTPAFKSEMKRCMTFLLAGASEGTEKDLAVARIRWLVEEYQNIWTEESGSDAEWRTFLHDEGLMPKSEGHSRSREELLEALRADPKGENDGDDDGSDVCSSSGTTVVGVGIGTTSTAMTGTSRLPIPASASTWSLLRTANNPDNSTANLNGRSVHPSSSSASLNPGRSKIPAMILNAGGLTGDLFIRLETSKIVESLVTFSKSRVAGFMIKPGDLVSPSLSAEKEDLLKEVSGSDDKPHWLTLLVVKHLLEQVGRRGSIDPTAQHPDRADLGGLHPAGSSSSLAQLHQQPQQSASSKANSATFIRAAVLSKWIQVGEKCRLAGDEVSWKAITLGVCCMAVARLEKVWRRVDELDRRMVEKWVKSERGLDGKARGRAKSRKTAWVGDLREVIADEVAKAGKLGSDSDGSGSEEIKVPALIQVIRKVEHTVKNWQEAFENGGNSTAAGAETEQSNDEAISGDVAALSMHWESLFEENKNRAPPPLRHYLTMSYAVEGRTKGRFSSSFWKPPTSPYPSTHALIPLLFPESLPCITLLDRTALVRGKKESLLGPHQSGVEVSEAQIRQVTGGRVPVPQKSQTLDAPVDKKVVGTSRTIADSELGERPLPSKDGDLVLKIPQEFPRSRPASILDSVPITNTQSALQLSSAEERKLGRGNSIRLSPAARLERKGSAARASRRSSLPSLSQRNSLIIPENAHTEQPAVRALVKSGTLDTLVDILVSGLDGLAEEGYADDNGEVSLREGKARAYKVDQLEFIKIWWCVFRSFMTPIVLFELLRKRYLGAFQGQERSTAGNHVAFQTDAPPVPSRKRVLGHQLRLDVLYTMTNWFTTGGGTQDVLDDYQLYQAVHIFLSTAPTDGGPAGVSSAIEGDTAKKEDVEKAREVLFRIFTTHIARPSLDITPTRDANAHGPSPRSFGSKPPALDAISPDDFVENLDSMACTVFRGVTEVHMFELADLLEAQTADRTGWFLSHESTYLSDDVIVQSIYSYIQHVEPSELVSDSHHESVHKLLTPSLRSVIRAHGTMREWLIAQLTAPGLGFKARQERMELYIRSIEVCRSRNADVDLNASTADVRQPVTRSFVEAALLAAVVSPESRVFARAWHNVAAARGGSVDDLLSFMPQHPVQRIPGKRLTIDLGWVIERMLEVITLPDTVDSSQAQILVNFDKRRYLHNLIVNAAGLTPRFKRASETERMDMERLNNMTKEAQVGIYELRVLRDEAARELLQASPLLASKKPVRPFNQIVAAQQEKSKRDKYLKERLAKEKRMEQLRADKRVSVLNRAMQPPKAMPLSQKQARHKKSMSGMSAFFRPLSTAFSSHTISSLDSPRRTAAELDFSVANLKPAFVLNLVGAGGRVFINDQRPFVFQLDTEDGGHFLIQTLGHKEREISMNAIKKTAEIAAMRRLTYLGHSKGKYNDLAEMSKSTPTKPSRVFGHDLMEVLCQESPTGEYIPGSLPRVVEMCLAEIERRGLTEVGVYRIAGSRSVSVTLRAEFDSGRPIDLSLDGDYADIHVVGDVLRQWLRELPETIFTNKLYHNFVDAMKIADYDDRNAMIRLLIWQLPRPNFDLVRRIIEHLDRVTDFEEQNQMSADALAICFNLTLFRSGLDDMKYTHALIKTCITQFHSLFNEQEQDHEGEQEFDIIEGGSDSDSVSGDNEIPLPANAEVNPEEMVSLNTPRLLGPSYENSIPPSS